MNFFIKLLDKI